MRSFIRAFKDFFGDDLGDFLGFTAAYFSCMFIFIFGALGLLYIGCRVYAHFG